MKDKSDIFISNSTQFWNNVDIHQQFVNCALVYIALHRWSDSNTEMDNLTQHRTQELLSQSESSSNLSIPFLCFFIASWWRRIASSWCSISFWWCSTCSFKCSFIAFSCSCSCIWWEICLSLHDRYFLLALYNLHNFVYCFFFHCILTFWKDKISLPVRSRTSRRLRPGPNQAVMSKQ